jgi:hypothetical protein
MFPIGVETIKRQPQEFSVIGVHTMWKTEMEKGYQKDEKTRTHMEKPDVENMCKNVKKKFN